MSKYDPLNLLEIQPETLCLHCSRLPELIHYDDPAEKALINICSLLSNTIQPHDSIDQALEEIKKTRIHFLLVVSRDGYLKGVISGQDILGEKPIKILQERRISRDHILVNMVMTTCQQFLVIDEHEMAHAKVGHIVSTLQYHKKQYALIVKTENENFPEVLGIFALPELSRQLHENLSAKR